MISDLKKCVGYICPSCSAVSVKNIGIFDFSSGKPYIALCECGEPCLQMQMQADKYRVAVRCPICGEVHSFFMSAPIFWKQELFVYECPASGIEIYFSGTEKEITEAALEQDEMFRDYTDGENTALLDGVLYDMMASLKKLTDSDRLYCSCGSRDIGVSFENAHMTLVCRECGAHKVIPVNPDGIEALSRASDMVLGWGNE